MFARLSYVIALFAALSLPFMAGPVYGQPDQGRMQHSTGAIVGLVIDAHGHVIVGANVQLLGGHHHVLGQTQTDHHGHFQFHHVPHGHHTVVASYGSSHGSTIVFVHGGHTSHVTIVLHPQHHH